MKKHPENLAAWLDGELPEADAAEVTQHVEACADCRKQAREYSQITAELAEYRTMKPARRWPRIAAWAGAAAAVILVAAALRPHSQPPVPISTSAVKPPEVRTEAPLPTPRTTERNPVRRPVTHKKRAPVQPDTPAYTGPVIRVAIPAEELFAPGALPPGTQIYADLTLAADGSPRELRLLP